MAIRHGTVTVGTEATDLTSAIPDTRDFSKHTVLLQNNTGVTVYLGGPGVTTSDFGYALAPGVDYSMDLLDGDVLFGVVDAAPVDVHVLHSGV
jgi:hypothetical protein